MRTIGILLTVSLGLLVVLCGCTQAPSGGTVTPAATTPGSGVTPASVTTPASGMANPAAVYCTEQQGTKYEIRKNPDGSEYGVCILPDGTECDEWDFYRGDCPGGSSSPGASTGIANPAAVYCTDDEKNRYEIRKNPEGSEYGVCILPDGTECEEWAYFRDECPEKAATTGSATGIANPAAVYCTEQPGTEYEIMKNPDGSEFGVCVLTDGTVCEEWAYFRGECAAETTTTAAALANPSATYCISKNYAYQTITNPDGSESGICIFPDGRSCDSWAYYRGECTEQTATA